MKKSSIITGVITVLVILNIVSFTLYYKCRDKYDDLSHNRIDKVYCLSGQNDNWRLKGTIVIGDYINVAEWGELKYIGEDELTAKDIEINIKIKKGNDRSYLSFDSVEHIGINTRLLEDDGWSISLGGSSSESTQKNKNDFELNSNANMYVDIKITTPEDKIINHELKLKSEQINLSAYNIK